MKQNLDGRRKKRISLTELAHQYLAEHVAVGDVVIDATCGNGYDTVLLAQLVGEAGQVVACDLQPQAIQQTETRCSGLKQVEYRLGDHAETFEQLRTEYEERVSAIVFNLGYLPGGDKEKTTQVPTTLKALSAGKKLLKSGGIFSILAYVGHPGGTIEDEAVRQLLSEWRDSGEVASIHWPEETLSAVPPRLYVVEKISRRDAEAQRIHSM